MRWYVDDNEVGLTAAQIDLLAEKLFSRISALPDDKVIKLTEMHLAEDSRLEEEIGELAYYRDNYKLTPSQLARYDKLIASMKRCNLVKAIGMRVSKQRGILNYDKFPNLREE